MHQDARRVPTVQGSRSIVTASLSCARTIVSYATTRMTSFVVRITCSRERKSTM